MLKPGGRLFLFFSLPLIRLHREFVFEVEGDRVSFLWHVPISDEERAYKQEHGTDALIDRMEAVELPWVFDEKNRPSLVEEEPMGNPSTPVIRKPAQGRTVAVLGDVYRFLATGEDTNGEYALFEALVDRYVSERHSIQSAKKQTRTPV